MKRKAYGRDAGLSLRMLLTSSLLGLLYVAFALVLFYVFNAGLVLMLVIVIGLAFFQYYTSDELAHELTHIANRDVLVMTVASFFAMLAAVLTRFGLYAGMFGGFGGGRNSNNNNSVPIWLIVIVVSAVTYALSWILIRTISRY